VSKGRVEAFSDGVFAVAITLLIFNIQVDKAAPGELFHALLTAWPKYAAYVASFLTIGVMLMNHHGLFMRIARLDRPLLLLNLLLLMAIVFLPASFYAGSALVIAIFFSALWTYLLTHPELLSPEVDRQAAIRAWPRFTVGLLAYLICVPLGQVSPIAVIVVCSAMAIYYTFERLPDIARRPADVVRRPD